MSNTNTLPLKESTLPTSVMAVACAPKVADSQPANPQLQWWEVLYCQIKAFFAAHIRDERGMSTVEYALGMVAAAALGALLYTVVTSDAVENALSGIIQRALKQK